MIKYRNLGEYLMILRSAGDQTAAAAKDVAMVPFTGYIKAIYAKVGTAGVTGNQVVDIHKNATTIFNGATKLTFATTKTNATYDALSADPTSVAKGDMLKLDVDSIHSGTAAKDLVVIIVIARKHPGKTETDTIGVRDE